MTELSQFALYLKQTHGLQISPEVLFNSYCNCDKEAPLSITNEYVIKSTETVLLHSNASNKNAAYYAQSQIFKCDGIFSHAYYKNHALLLGSEIMHKRHNNDNTSIDSIINKRFQYKILKNANKKK
eukprot:194088_1